MSIFIHFWIQGFIIGIVLAYLIYYIAFKVFWFRFKYIGKKHNLKTIRCKSCNNSFYSFDFETTTFCCNCILLNVNKE